MNAIVSLAPCQVASGLAAAGSRRHSRCSTLCPQGHQSSSLRFWLSRASSYSVVRFSNLHHLNNCMHDREPMVRIVRKKNDNLVLFVSIA
ncbi:unnamed protein product [Urochloa humidicola]